MRRLQLALEALSAESSRHKELQAACTAALAALDNLARHQSLTSVYEPDAQAQLQRELDSTLWKPFQLATERTTSSAKLREIALDGIQKMAVHGILLVEEGTKLLQQERTERRALARRLQQQANAVTVAAVSSSSMMEVSSEPPVVFQEICRPSLEVVKMVGEAVAPPTSTSSVSSEESLVQIQACKALLALVTSPFCEVHGRTLLNVLDVGLDVALSFPTSSASSLTSTNNASTPANVAGSTHAAASGITGSSNVSQATAKAALVQIVNVIMNRWSEVDKLDANKVNVKGNDGGDDQNYVMLLAQKEDTETVEKEESSEAAELTVYVEENSLEIVSIPEAAAVTLNTNGNEVDEDEVRIALNSPQQEPKTTTTTESPDLYDLLSRPNVEVSTLKELYQRDVLLTFKHLISVSLEHPTASALTLELVLSMVRKSVGSLRKDPIFIKFFKDELTPALITHIQREESQVCFELVVGLFLILLTGFRSHLISEMQEIFDIMVFPFLESDVGNSHVAYRRKYILLQAILKLCNNAQLMMDLYTIYDRERKFACFSRLVNTLSRISQGKSLKKQASTMESIIGSHAAGLLMDVNTDLAIIQDERSKVRGLRCLVKLVGSLCEKVKEETSNQINVQVEVCTAEEVEDLETSTAHLNTPNKLANFLLSNNATYSPVVLGGYLSNSKNGQVLEEVFKQLRLTEMDLVSALFKLLHYIRLPVEVEKSDRILQTFAYLFFSANQDSFSSTDSAYIITCTLLMLIADNSRNRVIGKQEFLRKSRELSTDVSDEYLGSLYDQIIAQQSNFGQKIPLYPTNSHVFNGFQQLKPHSQISDMFLLIWPPLMATLSVSFEETTSASSSLAPTSSTSASPESLSSQIIQLCLTAFEQAIWLASYFGLETERDAFVSSLSRLTGLNHVHQMKSKNYAAVRTLLAIANSCGQHLGTAWLTIMDVVSQLERLQLVAMEIFSPTMITKSPSTLASSTITAVPSSVTAGSTTDSPRRFSSPPLPSAAPPLRSPLPTPAEYIVKGHTRKSSFVSNVFSTEADLEAPNASSSGAGNHASGVVKPATNFLGSLVSSGINSAMVDGAKGTSLLADLSKEFQSQDIVKALDQLFTGSASLPIHSLCHFYRSLCQVALMEIQSVPNRLYCFQKVIEITHYNLGERSLFEWLQIWQILQPFFEMVGSQGDLQIAEYAVASFRVLCHMIISKEHAFCFQYHSETLHPFQYILAHTQYAVIEEMVLQSMEQLVKSHAIKSGWSAVFSTLAQAATKPSLSTVHLALQVHRSIASDLMKDLESFIGNAMVDAVSSLLVFISHPSDLTTVDDALKLLHQYGDFLVRSFAYGDEEEEEERFLRWFPLLSGLSRAAIAASSDEMRNRILESLFDLFKSYGDNFDVHFWCSSYTSVLMPLFEGCADPVAVVTEVDISTWVRASQFMTDSYGQFYQRHFTNDTELLAKLLDVLMKLFKRKQNEYLNQHAITLYLHLLEENAAHLSSEQWLVLTEMLETCFSEVTPTELIIPLPELSEDIISSSSSVGVPGDDSVSDAAVSVVTMNTYSNVDQLMEEQAQKYRHQLDFNAAVAKCTLQLFLIQSLDNVLRQHQSLASQIPENVRSRWQAVLYQSFNFAHQFNQNKPLRTFIWKSGFVKQMPNLFKQEMVALMAFLRLGFSLYKKLGDADKSSEQALDESERLLLQYADMLAEPAQYQRELQSWTASVMMVWEEFISLLSSTTTTETKAVTFNNFQQRLPQLFQIAVRMLATEKADLRLALQEFIRLVGQLYLKVPPKA